MEGRHRQRSPDPRILDQLRDLTDAEFWEYVKARGIPRDEAFRILWWLENDWRYHERPVDPETFLFSPAYMRATNEAGHSILWPEVTKAIVEICSKPYVEAVLTGGIGVAKTTIALYVQAYEIYKLLCHHNPHDVYGLDPSSEIVVAFQSLSLNKATGVDYQRLRNMLERAPIFSDQNFRFASEIKSRMVFPKNVEAKPLAGTEEANLGENVIGAHLDEIAAMKYVKKSARTRDSGEYDQAVKLYTSIARRRQSRFMQLGEMPGKLILTSSKKYPGDLLHQKMEEARDRSDEIYLYDKCVWDVKPWDFGKKRFRVFVGDRVTAPRILEPGEEVEKKHLKLVKEVPVEYAGDFKKDLVGSLRDIASVSTLATHPFIMDRDSLGAAFGKVRSVATRPDVDFKSTQLAFFPERWEGTERFPRFCHIDPGLTGDSLGLAIGHVPKFKKIRRSKVVVEAWPVVRFDLVLEVKPPPGAEIKFEKVRTLLYKLREHGLPIKWVTSDSWQSTDMLQILQSRGFIVGQESTDKTAWPYQIFKAALYDRRVLAPNHPKALDELAALELDPTVRTAKIDQPPDHPEDGSKDVADAMACVAFGLTLMSEVWGMHRVPSREVPMILERAVEDTTDKRDVDGRMAAA